jgi:ketosteroid isomerase-like protein
MTLFKHIPYSVFRVKKEISLMKNLALYSCILLFSFSVFADEKQQNLTVEQDQQIHTELRALLVTMQRAKNEQDIDTIYANIDENIIFSTMNGEVIQGRDNLRAYYEKMMKGPDRIVESITYHFVPDKPSILHEDDVAIAFGHSNDVYKLAVGEAFEANAIWSATILRKNGSWKIANFHYSVNMFDNPILDAQKKLLWILGIGSILLPLVSFFIGRRLKKSV